MKNGIRETTEFLELFLRNLLSNEDHPFHNRSLHIRGIFRISEKANIEDIFTAKTAAHVCRLLDNFGFQPIFGRSDVQNQ